MRINIFNRWKMILVFFVMLTINLFIVSKIVTASDESDSWIIPDDAYNKYQRIKSTEGPFIIQEGDHPKGTSNVFYRTAFFYMTLNQCNNTYAESNAFDSFKKSKVPVIVHNEPSGDTVTATYKMKKLDFLDAMRSLGVTSQKIKDNGGSITVYMHNVFELYNPNEPKDPVYSGYTDILGYKEMMQQGDKITGYHGGWPDDTREALKYYYNFPYVVTPTLFNVEVVAATEVNGKIQPLKTLKPKATGMLCENFPLDDKYTAPDNFTASNGMKYKAKGYWYVRFNRRTNNELVQGEDHEGMTVKNYSLPDANADSTVTIYFAYEPTTKQADIVLNAVDMDDGKIIKQLHTGKITPGQKFDQPEDTLNPNIPYNSLNYTRTKNYCYEYSITGGGTKKTSGSEASDSTPVSFTVPNDIKENTVLTVNIYYKKAPPGSIPVIVKAVDKATGAELQSLGSGSAESSKLYTHNQTIPDKISTYSFSGEWDWSYTKNTSTKPTIPNKGSGTKISFTAPAKDKVIGSITVKVYYNGSPPADEITLRVIMVNSSGNIIDELSRETVSRGQSISKTAGSQKSVNNILYTYMNKWEYQFSTSAGITIKSGTGSTAAFAIPSGTTMGSIVTLKFYYDGKPPKKPDPPEDPIKEYLDIPTPYGVINGDSYNSPYFLSRMGISTTESQHVYVKTKDYLLSYELVNRTGKKTYYVPVTMHYTLEYYSATPVEYGGPKKITEDVQDKRVIEVERKYNYWEITELQYYNVSSAEVRNYSLPGESVTLTADSKYLDIPSLSTWHSSEIDDHVIAPKQEKEGIEVWNEVPITSKTSVRPEVEFKDLTSYAEEQTDQASVRSDYLMFDGSVVMDNSYQEEKGSHPMPAVLRQLTTLSQDKALFTEGKVVKADKDNGTYSSNGTVTYKLHPESVNASNAARSYPVPVNDVIIHTPVICDPVITADNDKWVQLKNPEEGAVQIVLDPDTSLNDFKVKINNTLSHSSRLGYYTRDFSRSFIDPDNISYIAKMSGIVRNEMKLPFDVYIDNLEDNNKTNDKYIKAGTWIVLGRAASRFYVPMWVQEGTYTAEFRTIAVNGTDKLAKTERTRNSDISKYVAVDKRTFEISGRIYGLKLYDISDYPKWEEAFRKQDTMLFKLFEGFTDGTKMPAYASDYAYYYSVGTKNQYGVEIGRYNKYTLPLVNGSHPRYKNLGVLKTGYAVRFMLDTTGEMYSSGCRIKIIPTFYYVDSKGKNRKQVDLYYKEEIGGKSYPLVKVGEGVDLVNIQSGTTGNIYSRIPEKEITNTAAVMNTTYAKIANQYSTMYSYSQLKLLKEFRTFIGTEYASLISGLSSFTDVKNTTGLTKTSLSKYVQRWYGTYKLPMNVHAVPTGYDVYDYLKKHGIDYKENFWLTGGYIIVNFNIVTIDKNGKEHLSYINGSNYLNNGNCSMWVMEGAPAQKTDNKGNAISFKAGDFIIYYTDKKMSDDYEVHLYQ